MTPLAAYTISLFWAMVAIVLLIVRTDATLASIDWVLASIWFLIGRVVSAERRAQ